MSVPLISPPLKAASFQLAGASDWPDWALTVEAALSSRDLWDHIIASSNGNARGETRLAHGQCGEGKSRFKWKDVELSCTNGDGSLDITYVVSLFPISISTAVIVQNNGTKPTKLTSAMLSHFRFKSRGGSAIQGLQGCSYCSHPPLASSFGILSPSDAMEPDPPGWFSFLDSSSQEKLSPNIDEPEAWKVEDDLYTVLKRKFSRVYAAPPSERRKRIYNTSPSKYQTIDQVFLVCVTEVCASEAFTCPRSRRDFFLSSSLLETNLAIRGDAECSPSPTQFLWDKILGFSTARVNTCRVADIFLQILY
ncbi:hypothetical protein KSP39_PZI003184 [Platanthera zijinensis]|uniref:Uncharacterized protein n=1 Tax=Platanthera zijinensis TaxID=2320716 RepID=A0AAP0BXG6_9ASPA